MLTTLRPRRAASFILLGLLGALCPLALAACGTARDPGEAPKPTPTFELPKEDAAPPAPPVCGVHCSRDLKRVLDGCEGAERVVEECTKDQGCGKGTCLDACTAVALSKGSTGCDFWAVQPDDLPSYRGACYAAMIANTWDRPVALSADFGAASLDISKSTYTVKRKGIDPEYTVLSGPLPPGEVAIVFLAHDPLVAQGSQNVKLCPDGVTPALTVDPIRHGTSKTQAFHLKADAPIAAYTIFPYGGADSYVPTATLLLPSTAWDKSYVAVSPNDFGTTLRRRTLQIVANEDDTEVSMRPTVEIPSGQDVAGAARNVTQSWKLSRGQVLQLTQASLTGSPIATSKPVGLFGGSVCTELPLPYCDTMQQQIPPFAMWGTEYALVPYKPRLDSFSPDIRESVPYSIVGAVNGTTLTYEPSRPLGAPEKLEAGESAHFIADSIVVVRSQDSKHPIYASVYMTGSTYGGGTPGKLTLGDPDFVNVPASDQFLDRYIFFTDFTFPLTTLTVVRRKTAKGFSPVTIDCAGEITGWQPIGTGDKYEWTWVTLTEGFVPQKFPKGECSYGRQEAKSDGPFSVTVWGVGRDASYGYVAGTGLRPINDAPPPAVR